MSGFTPPVVAVLGGGQLGRMLGLAGVPLGLDFRFLDPSPQAPAQSVGELVVGALDDERALLETVDGCAGRDLRVGRRPRRRGPDARGRRRARRSVDPRPRGVAGSPGREDDVPGPRDRRVPSSSPSTTSTDCAPRSEAIGSPGRAEDAARRLRRQRAGGAADTEADVEPGICRAERRRSADPRRRSWTSTGSSRCSRCATATARCASGR